MRQSAQRSAREVDNDCGDDNDDDDDDDDDYDDDDANTRWLIVDTGT